MQSYVWKLLSNVQQQFVQMIATDRIDMLVLLAVWYGLAGAVYVMDLDRKFDFSLAFKVWLQSETAFYYLPFELSLAHNAS